MNGCEKYQPMLETYVDGELEVDSVLEVERHLGDCAACQEITRFARALKRSVREVVLHAEQVPPSFRNQLETVLCAERRRLRKRPGLATSWANLVPWVAAAVVLLFVGNARLPRSSASRDAVDNEDLVASKSSSKRPPDIQPALNIDEFLDDFVQYHTEDNEPDVTESLLVPAQFEREVGVPVRVPSLGQYGARWEGGSVVPVRESRAALLRYRLDGHRVTVYVYDSGRMPLRARLEPLVVRDTPVYVGTRRGYTIAASEKLGVGYAVATDLGMRESAELVATMR